MLLTELCARVGDLQQCCSPRYSPGLAFYINAAHPDISEGWHLTTMLLTQLKVKVGTLQQCCLPGDKLVLPLYNNAAHPVIREY
jgi:hypothetical protein